MRLRLRVAWLIAGAITFTGIVPIGLSAEVACASTGNRAVLVVDTGGGAHRFCVEIPSGGTTGIGLIRLAGTQHGLDYRLGYGGAAVCRLAGVGPDGGDCFAEHPDFWGYWRGDGSGGWNWSSGGAGSTSVKPGAVEGWSWGSGDGPESHPRPPSTTFGSVCPKAAAAKPKAPRSGGKKPSAAKSQKDATGGEVVVETTETEEKRKKGKGKKKTKKDGVKKGKKAGAGGKAVVPVARSSPTPSASPGALGAADPASSQGPPPAGLAALGATVALGIGGALFLRRRRSV